jgi:hypothetical protein
MNPLNANHIVSPYPSGVTNKQPSITDKITKFKEEDEEEAKTAIFGILTYINIKVLIRLLM